MATIRFQAALFGLRGVHLFKRTVRFLLKRVGGPARRPEPAKARHDRLVRAAAGAMALKVDELPYGFLRISDGRKTIYSSDFNFSFDSLTAYWMCGDKHLTSLLLREAGVPVPDFAVFPSSDLGSAFSAFNRLTPPLVVKPCFGAGGDGITVGVLTLPEFRRACYRAAVMADRIIVERLVHGRHWRITLFDGQLVFACERLPAFVVGDGQSSIQTLIDRFNHAIRERDGFPGAYPIQIDNDTRDALRKQSVTPDSIPPPGHNVILKAICNAAVGGRTVDISSKLHPDYLTLARRAAATMGARLAGVDIIAPDASAPIVSGAVFINEVNTTPDLLLSHFDISGSGNAIASVNRLLAMVFADRLNVRESEGLVA
jgi:cyanophycin synthetase